jgi:phosphoglucomutase
MNVAPKSMKHTIKFGTDGWRAIIADTYTVENVSRVAEATALWGKSLTENPVMVIGFDCRFGGRLFMETTARVLAEHGVKVLVNEHFVSTPMVSLATQKTGSIAGIVITASHNPPSYNGFKIKASYGGPASPSEIDKIENLIPENISVQPAAYEYYKTTGMIEVIDAEGMYEDQVNAQFDMKTIQDPRLNFAYDAMFGAGQDVMRHLMPDATFLHCDHNPGFEGQAPEPIHKNLREFSEMIEMAGDIDSGLATDGDADRIGLYNKEGKFIDSHHIILILINYLHQFKGMSGKVVNSFSCTSRIKKMCDHFGLPQETTRIGFKYICDIIVAEDVLIGGEESGGIAIKGHIPERDGIWIGLVIWEYMAKTGKSLDDLINDVYAITGPFALDRDDLHVEEAKKQEIIQHCVKRQYARYGTFNVQNVEDLDGFKFNLGDERWVMIRPSGTEPVLRIYAEAENAEMVRKILDETRNTLFA